MGVRTSGPSNVDISAITGATPLTLKPAAASLAGTPTSTAPVTRALLSRRPYHNVVDPYVAETSLILPCSMPKRCAELNGNAAASSSRYIDMHSSTHPTVRT